ncbi:hypothetical protein K435DRAFT_693539 [Dendrothele bispora CBS 962.96]|uniref:Uncharacterized protein n=1 Tax=Dendrothele bispora (strain CBS 962.96) TaxID=1314807 RepID=A0A4S8KNH7_DENBC|nr:hypothetical protein K435DRAFT_702972 [Dendrothele bispora CBS 962.96]THU81471.1 hypothetical protein K435DRAFT_693539 [Dendrothele bispora CBS 962.96]
MSGLICSICRMRGKNLIFNTDRSQWTRRDVEKLRHWANAYRNANTLAERKAIFDDHGVRWSSLWLLEYWDPTRMLVIDTMHCILEGVVHYHCRYVLRLFAAAPQLSADGFKHAYDYPWIPYDVEVAPSGCNLEEKHVPLVAKIQEVLCLSLKGDKAMTLDQVWTRLDNQGTRDALRFVAHTLDLPVRLDGVCETVKTLYVQRGKRKAKHPDRVQFPSGQFVATKKNHYIALLLDWRLNQALSSEAHIIRTGTPETLAHIQHVIRETTTPSWLNSVPKNYGEAKAGSIKADEWRTLSTVYLPIALITLWGDNDGFAPPEDNSEPGYLLKALDHTMALFQATVITCRYTMTTSRVIAVRDYLESWVKDLRTLFPHSRGVWRPNIHAAGHIYDFLLLYGPVISWWCFPFERLIGALQKINTNDHIGGRCPFLIS